MNYSKQNCPFRKMSSRQGHIRRPMNSFMVWSREKRCEILKCNPGMSNAVISKKLGMTWKGMTAEDKKPYIEEAKRLTWKHKQDHPDYKYRPRRHSKGKNKNKCDASRYERQSLTVNFLIQNLLCSNIVKFQYQVTLDKSTRLEYTRPQVSVLDHS